MRKLFHFLPTSLKKYKSCMLQFPYTRHGRTIMNNTNILYPERMKQVKKISITDSQNNKSALLHGSVKLCNE